MKTHHESVGRAPVEAERLYSPATMLSWFAKELLPHAVITGTDTASESQVLRTWLDDAVHPGKASYNDADLVAALAPLACFRPGMTGPRVASLTHLLYRWNLLPPDIHSVVVDEHITALERLNGYAGFRFAEKQPHMLQVLVQMRLQSLNQSFIQTISPHEVARIAQGKWLIDANLPTHFDRVSLTPRRSADHDLLISRPGTTARELHVAKPWPHRSIMTNDGQAYVSGVNPVLEVKSLNRSTFLLARHARANLSSQMIAVTGSSGKTSVRAMIGRMLAEQRLTRMTADGFNSRYASATRLINLPMATQACVFECGLGATGSGLSTMSEMIQPDIALVTSVAAAHLGGYGSVLEIARKKLDIAKHLAPNGHLIVDGDSPVLEEALREMPNADRVCIIRVGVGAHCPVRVLNVQVSETGTVAHIDILGVVHTVELPMHGNHWGQMAAMALLCCQLAGADVEMAKKALSRLVFDHKGRGELHRLHVAGGVLRVFDSHYNANPGSMRAELNAFAALAKSIESPDKRLRRVALIGAMAELGDDNSTAIHQDLVGRLANDGFHRLLLVGKQEFAPCLDMLRNSGRQFEVFESTQEALQALEEEAQPNRFIFVKGSNKWDLCQAVTRLRMLPTVGHAQPETISA